MQPRSARVLLVIFALSVSVTQLIELGHGVLHSIENPFHYHKASKYKDFKDHSIVDHHFPKMKFAHEMDEPQPSNNFIALVYGFFQTLSDYQFFNSSPTQSHCTRITEHDYVVYSTPPTPPPLEVVPS